MSKLKSIAIALSLLLVAMNVLAGSSGSGDQVASDDPMVANAPPLPSQIRLWEAWAKGYATVMQVSGAAHTITNVGPASVIIDEHIMLMSPSPSNPSEDVPGIDDEAQDGVLTPTYTVPAGGTLDFNYGDSVLLYGSSPPAWWCTEDSEWTNSPIPITMGGEIFPYDLWDEVDNPDGTPVLYNMLYSTTAAQAAIWTYIRENPTLLIGKLPLWKEIGNMGDEVDVTLDVTNIGFQTAYGVVVTDTIPAGYSYDPSSFTHTPSAITNNPDGSITLKWTIQQFPAAVQTGDTEPTDYTTVYIGYKLLTPVLDPDIRIFLPRAYVDRNGDGVNDVESEEPLLETYLVNRPPVAVVNDVTIAEGDTAVLDGSSSYDPDEPLGDSIVSYEWDLDDDGVFDATGPVVNKEYGDNGNFNVMLRVADSWGVTSTDTAVVTVYNVAPSGGETIENGDFSAGMSNWNQGLHDYVGSGPYKPLPSSRHSTSTANGYLEAGVENGYNEVYQDVEVSCLNMDLHAGFRAAQFGTDGGRVSIVVSMFKDQPPEHSGNPPDWTSMSEYYDLLLGHMMWYFRPDMVHQSDDTHYNELLGTAPSGWYALDANLQDIIDAHLPGIDESQVKWLRIWLYTYGESGGFTIGDYDDISLKKSILCGYYSSNEGDEFTIATSVFDPGSDDLTFLWSWGYAPWCDDSTIYYNNGLSPDLPQSPDVNPMEITEAQACEYGDNGVYAITLTVTDDDGGSTTDSVPLAVGNVDPAVLGGISARMDIDLGIRVAGSKWSNVMLELVDDEGNSVQLLEVERWPGSPDKNPSVGISSVTLDMTKSYKAVVTYDPFPDDGDAVEGDQGNNGKDKWDNAGNPVWLTIAFEDGTFIELHHTFNTQQSKHKGSDHWNHVEPWVVELSPYLVGHEFEMSAEASDVGSDDITFEWSCGFLNTYYNDDVGPDPFPSPEGNYPFSAEDSVPHIYVGPETISLTVYDDDGGTVTETIGIP